MTEQADWDIVTGVGLTALAVAAGRAIETHRPDRLVADPYAEVFVQAARPPVPMPTRPGDDHDPAVLWESTATYMGVRSKFFDEFFAAASEAGVRQAVLFAAGLDCRAFRLDWPSALRKAGFDPDLPTAWLAEGLLPYLPDDAKEMLLARVDELSASGSRIAVEYFNGDMATLLREPAFREMADRFGFDVSQLLPADQNHDVTGWLTGHGWAVTTESASAAAGRNGRPFDDVLLQPMRSSLLITAQAPDR